MHQFHRFDHGLRLIYEIPSLKFKKKTNNDTNDGQLLENGTAPLQKLVYIVMYMYVREVLDLTWLAELFMDVFL